MNRVKPTCNAFAIRRPHLAPVEAGNRCSEPAARLSARHPASRSTPATCPRMTLRCRRASAPQRRLGDAQNHAGEGAPGRTDPAICRGLVPCRAAPESAIRSACIAGEACHRTRDTTARQGALQRREEAERRGDPPPSSITLRAGRRWESIGRQWAVRDGRRKSAFPSSGGLLVSKQIQIEVELIGQ